MSGCLPKQIVGNVGLYYVCYKLSRLGWNAMPTCRNARGIDVICFTVDGKETVTLQVKSLSGRQAVSLGSSLDGILGDFWVIANNLRTDNPRCYVMTAAEVRERAHKNEKDGKVSFWLELKDYAIEKFEEKWERVAGTKR